MQPAAAALALQRLMMSRTERSPNTEQAGGRGAELNLEDSLAAAAGKDTVRLIMSEGGEEQARARARAQVEIAAAAASAEATLATTALVPPIGNESRLLAHNNATTAVLFAGASVKPRA